jgi:hypothetical protein
MTRSSSRQSRFLNAEIQPGRGAWSDQWLWTLYLRGAPVASGYAADRHAAIEAASDVAAHAAA